MDELKRACLWLLTTRAWLDTAAPLESRKALMPGLDRLLFWYREPMSKRWLRQAGVEQLRDWDSAWRARVKSLPEGLVRDAVFVDAVLLRLAWMVARPKSYGLRQPESIEALRAWMETGVTYRNEVQDAISAKGLDFAAMTPIQDELQIYFERLDTAVR